MRAQYFRDITEHGVVAAGKMSFLVEQGHDAVFSQSYRSAREVCYDYPRPDHSEARELEARERARLDTHARAQYRTYGLEKRAGTSGQ